MAEKNWLRNVLFVLIGLLVILLAALSASSRFPDSIIHALGWLSGLDLLALVVVGSILAAKFQLNQLRTTRYRRVVRWGTIEQVRSALSSGADANERFIGGVTPLLAAALENRNPGVVGALLKAGADVNAQDESGSTPLVHAIRGGNAEAAIALAEGGADVNGKFEEGATPLMMALATDGCDPRVIEALLAAGADVNGNDHERRTPLMYAVAANRASGLICRLAKSGADVNARDRAGMTALMIAASKGKSAEALRALLDLGADAKVRDDREATALDYAGKNADLEGTEAYRSLMETTQR